MEEHDYTLKDCIEFNERKFKSTLNVIRGNYVNKECKELALPDSFNPCNTLHYVIHEFYSRELERAAEIDTARCVMRELKEIKDINKQLNTNYWDMQKKTGELKDENSRLKSELESKSELPTFVKELLVCCDAREWVGILNGVIDNLIASLDIIEDGSVSNSLFYIRKIQDRFIELEEETREQSK